jgi:hypothetical protein
MKGNQRNEIKWSRIREYWIEEVDIRSGKTPDNTRKRREEKSLGFWSDGDRITESVFRKQLTSKEGNLTDDMRPGWNMQISKQLEEGDTFKFNWLRIQNNGDCNEVIGLGKEDIVRMQIWGTCQE